MNFFERLPQLSLKNSRTKKALDRILLDVESVKGGFDLQKVFTTIGEDLGRIGISVLVLIFDESRENLSLRYLSAPLAENSRSEKSAKLLGHKTPIKELKKCRQVIEGKKSCFTHNRLRSLGKNLSVINEFFDPNERYNSVISPIKVRGEVIGVIDFISKSIEEEDLALYDRFSQDLARGFSDIILFHEIRQSEKKYRTLVDNAEDGVAIISPRGHVVFSNRAMHRITGYNRYELSTMHFSKLVHPEDLPMVSRRFRSRLANQPTMPTYEFRLLHKSGRTVSISYSGSPIIESDQVTGIQAVVRDITGTKELEQEIRQAKDHYEQVIDAIQDNICVIDRQHRIVSYNKLFARQVDLPLESIKGQDYREVIARFRDNTFDDCRHRKKECCQSECLIARAFEQGKTQKMVKKGRGKNGQIFYHRYTVFPKKDEQGNTYELVIIIRDITARMNAEAEARRMHEFNQRILDNAPVSIVLLNKEGVIEAANNLARDLMERPDKKLVGRRLIDTRQIKKNQELIRMYDNLLNKGETFYYEDLRYFNSKKQERCLNIYGIPLFNRHKQVEGAISMALDNTETIRTREELEQLNRDLEKIVKQRTHELNEINLILSESNELKSKFIADASHELRTPLTVIQGNLDLAIREARGSNNEPSELFFQIIAEVERMTRILSDLTMLTNADAGTERIESEPIDLNRLVISVGRSLKVLADQKRIALVYSREGKKINILGDEAKLEKLLLNIVRNAIKYTEPKGRVKIWHELKEKEAWIHVQDTGIGIPQADLPFIFERFYRVDKARARSEGGTGLGLAICKWIAEMHGGRIDVHSQLNEGTTFIIKLPLGNF